MILLDTNVLSEFMPPRPSASVVSWLDEQPAAEVYTNAISRAEIELGLMLMSPGKRQEALSQAARAMLRTSPGVACRSTKTQRAIMRASFLAGRGQADQSA